MNELKKFIQNNFANYSNNVSYSDNIIKIRLNIAKCDFILHDNGYVIINGINNKMVDISNICKLEKTTKYITRFFEFNKMEQIHE